MYPWPSFSSFTWRRPEAAIYGSDSGWRRSPSYNQQRALGSGADTLLLLGAGSYTRSFECLLHPDRHGELAALVSITGTFTDWRRPLPDSRAALLRRVDWVEEVVAGDYEDYGNETTRVRIRTRVELVSQ